MHVDLNKGTSEISDAKRHPSPEFGDVLETKCKANRFVDSLIRFRMQRKPNVDKTTGISKNGASIPTGMGGGTRELLDLDTERKTGLDKVKADVASGSYAPLLFPNCSAPRSLFSFYLSRRYCAYLT